MVENRNIVFYRKQKTVAGSLATRERNKIKVITLLETETDD